MSSRAPNEVVPGPISRRVVENVLRLRAERGLTREGLSELLSAAGRPIRATGLARLEAGRRRVDVDDLVGLAVALGVSPAALLLPVERVDEVALTDTMSASWAAAWRWAVGEQPLLERGEELQLADPRVRKFIRSNRPFERRRYVDEAAAGLNARESPPFTATIRNDGTRTRVQFTYDSGDPEE